MIDRVIRNPLFVLTIVSLVSIASRTSVSQDAPRSAESANQLIASGWATEAFSENAGKQLKKIGEVIVASKKSAALSGILSDSYQIRRLRPEALETAFQDASVQVFRQRRQLSSVAPVRNIQVALQSLHAGRGSPTSGRTKFKVFQVQIRDQIGTTKCYFQAFMQYPKELVQVNATWTCEWSEVMSQAPRLTSLRVAEYEEAVYAQGESLFSDCTESVVDAVPFDAQFRMGVDHWLDRIESHHGIDIGGWQGLAIGDVNNDTLEDVYVCAPGGLPNRLFVQNAGGSTREIAAEAGIDWLDSSHAALFVDLDNDADQDLIVGVDSGVIILSNDGRGRFVRRCANVFPAALPYSISASDYDSDGDLDLFVCCYNRRRGINQHLLFARPVPYHDANNGGRNVLLQNASTPSKGPWRFRYATGRTGLDANNRKFSYASAWEDYDNDGDSDLYVANDFGKNNLYRNDGGRFTEVTSAAGVEDIGPGMSACWGDSNNDGLLDLYVSNMFSSAGNRITNQQQFHSNAAATDRLAFRRHARGNSLFLNRGDGTFKDVSQDAAVTLGRWAWGSKFVDLNNDGWQDLIVANGFITQEDTTDL